MTLDGGLFQRAVHTLDLAIHCKRHSAYRAQVTRLAEALAAEENRGEAADILRSLVDRITLTPNAEGKLDIDLYGDLAGILNPAMGGKERRDAQNGEFARQVKVVAGARDHLDLQLARLLQANL